VKRLCVLAALGLAACGGGAPPPAVEARQYEDPGFVTDAGFEMRYGTVLAADLPEAVADLHGIERRRDRLVVNLSVLRRREGGVPIPVEATVGGSWRGLVSEPEPLQFRQVVAAGAASYLAVLPVADREVIVLELHARPDGAVRPLRARVTRSFDTK
jgi:hypothetical protein